MLFEEMLLVFILKYFVDDLHLGSNQLTPVKLRLIFLNARVGVT
jgi:hypothetical protein